MEKKYYKPHFGPEATLEQIAEDRQREKQQKLMIFEHLNDQVSTKKTLTNFINCMEREEDLKNIQVHSNLFH